MQDDLNILIENESGNWVNSGMASYDLRRAVDGYSIISGEAGSLALIDFEQSQSTEIVQISGDTTFSFLNLSPTRERFLILKENQNSERSLTWPSGIKWSNGDIPITISGSEYVASFYSSTNNSTGVFGGYTDNYSI